MTSWNVAYGRQRRISDAMGRGAWPSASPNATAATPSGTETPERTERLRKQINSFTGGPRTSAEKELGRFAAESKAIAGHIARLVTVVGADVAETARGYADAKGRAAGARRPTSDRQVDG